MFSVASCRKDMLRRKFSTTHSHTKNPPVAVYLRSHGVEDYCRNVAITLFMRLMSTCDVHSFAKSRFMEAK